MNDIEFIARQVKTLLSLIDSQGLSAPYSEAEIDEILIGDDPNSVRRTLLRVHQYCHEILYAPKRG